MRGAERREGRAGPSRGRAPGRGAQRPPPLPPLRAWGPRLLPAPCGAARPHRPGEARGQRADLRRAGAQAGTRCLFHGGGIGLSTCPGRARTGGTQSEGEPLRPAGPAQSSGPGALSPSLRSAESSKAPALGRDRSGCQRPHGERRLQGQRQESVLERVEINPWGYFLGAIAPTLRTRPAEIPLGARGRARLGTLCGVGAPRFRQAARPPRPALRAQSTATAAEPGAARGLGEEPHGRSQAWPRSCPAARPERPRDERGPWGPCLTPSVWPVLPLASGSRCGAGEREPRCLWPRHRRTPGLLRGPMPWSPARGLRVHNLRVPGGSQETFKITTIVCVCLACTALAASVLFHLCIFRISTAGLCIFRN